MNKNRLRIIKQELLGNGLSSQIITKQLISTKHVNTDLILFVCRILSNYKSVDDKKLVLLNLKKLIIQTPRLPDPDQYRVDREFFDSIKKEQLLNDPIKFIEAEIEFLKETEASNSNQEEWLTESQVLKQFGISTVTLRRRIADGMPCSKVGGKKLFSRKLIADWLIKKGEVTW